MSDSTHRRAGTSTPVSSPLRDELLHNLRDLINPEPFHVWVRSIRSVRADGTVLSLELPNENYRNKIAEQFSEPLTTAARALLGPDAKVVLKASGSSPECDQRSKSNEPSVASESFEELPEARGPYIRVYHHWLKELRPKVGRPAWDVYETLLCFVWRGETKTEEMRKRIERGELVAYVSRRKLALSAGLGHETIRRGIRRLEQLELVQTTNQPHGRSNFYRLGYRDEKGERWFADLVLARLRQR